MFSTAYIRHAQEEGSDKNKWQSRTLKCILVGSCPKLDALLFFHPQTKKLLTCGEVTDLIHLLQLAPNLERNTQESSSSPPRVMKHAITRVHHMRKEQKDMW
eukprot:3421209-Ditylum_brightwellii.AAC.2